MPVPVSDLTDVGDSFLFAWRADDPIEADGDDSAEAGDDDMESLSKNPVM